LADDVAKTDDDDNDDDALVLELETTELEETLEPVLEIVEQEAPVQEVAIDVKICRPAMS